MYHQMNRKTTLLKTKKGLSSNASKTVISQIFSNADLCDKVCQNKHKRMQVKYL